MPWIVYVSTEIWKNAGLRLPDIFRRLNSKRLSAFRLTWIYLTSYIKFKLTKLTMLINQQFFLKHAASFKAAFESEKSKRHLFLTNLIFLVEVGFCHFWLRQRLHEQIKVVARGSQVNSYIAVQSSPCLLTWVRPSRSLLKSNTGAPFLFRAVGLATVILGKFPSPWISNVRLRYFDIALGIPSTAASSVALYVCMEGGVNVTVAYT